MLDSRRAKIAKKLRDVFVGQRATGFQFDDQFATDEKIGSKSAKQSAVFIEDIERMLLEYLES